MVVLYLLSIQSAVFDIAQLYAATGFLRLRTSLKMPLDYRLDFDPNFETEWNNEAIEYNECLYEHRDHTNFIAFTTLDDIIISSPTDIKPLAPIFANLSMHYPDSPEFVLRVHQSLVESLDDVAGNIWNSTGTTENIFEAFDKLWSRGIFLSAPIADPIPNTEAFYVKTVVVPDRVQTVWLHRALSVEPGGTFKETPYTQAFVMHLRHELTPEHKITYPRINELNTDNAALYAPLMNVTDRMMQNFRTVFTHYQNLNHTAQSIEELLNNNNNYISSLIERLPQTESFMKEFREFNHHWGELQKILFAENSTLTHRCHNYLHHPPLKSKIAYGCINAENKWNWRTFFNVINVDYKIPNATITNVAILDQRSFELKDQCTNF